MIITKISGGLGNQLFQYAVGKAICVKHNTNLKLDITSYNNYKLHNGFRLDQLKADIDIASRFEIFSFKKWGLYSFRGFQLHGEKKYLYEKERTIYDDQILLYSNAYIDGYWQNQEYFLSIRNLLLDLYQPKSDLGILANNYINQIESSNSVSIHIRRGDYLNHPEIGVLDIEYYLSAIEYIKGKCKNPTLFIFSNDLDWCKYKFKNISNIVFVSKTYSEIEDLFLMSRCRHNIIANSSFSWWGAWLNKNIDKIIVSPKKWMAKNPNNYKWVPDDWIEI